MPPSTTIISGALCLPPLRTTVGGKRRAVPRFDEDVTTLAAEATLEAGGAGAAALVLGTVSAEQIEGGPGPVLAEMLEIDGPVIQVGGTTAAGGGALIAGLGLVASGIAPVAVVGADTRTDSSGGPGGAGAAVLILGNNGEGGTIRHVASSSGWFPDVWRDRTAERPTWGDRSFARYAPAPPDADHTVTATGPEIDGAGALGCAALGATMLLNAPETGLATRFAVTAGGLRHVFDLTGGPEGVHLRERASTALAHGCEGPLPEAVDLDAFDPYASEPRAVRERAQDLRLEGVRDTETGEVFFPPIPATSRRPLEPFRLARRGRVVTHTRDHVYPVGGPISMVVVDLEGGGRFYGQTAWDFEVSIDMPVRLVPRLLHRGGGMPQYFWKVAPGEVR